jgi:hypothetical protein
MHWRRKEQSLYYCWFCDAHRVPAEGASQAPCCPRCGQELPAESRIESHSPRKEVATPRVVMGHSFALPVSY